MTQYDARDIANFFLDYAQEKGETLSNLSLLKIIYYAHGWHFRKFGGPLVKNTFEAWEHGPVVRTVYDSFKGWGSSPIQGRAKKFCGVRNAEVLAMTKFPDNTAEFLRGIFDFYSKISPIKLSEMTHEANGPWDIIMKKSKREVCLQLKIPNELIAEHFCSLQGTAH